MESAQIQVVEDESIVALYLQKRLQHLGYNVSVVVSSGEEAIKKAEETLPDLVLMDITLDGKINGIEAADQIRTRFNIPVLFLTDHPDSMILQRAKKTEPFDYLLKSFEEKELHTTIEMALYRHKIETELKEIEEQYLQLVERLPDGVYRSTTDGKLLTVNSALARMLGYESHEELLNINITKDLYFSPKERNEALKMLNGHESKSLIFRLKKKDGSELWVEDHGHQVFDGQGRLIYYEGILRDITKRKLAEEALKESEERFRTIFENANDGILLADVENRKFYTGNKKICQMLGYSLEEIKNIRVMDIHPAKDLPYVVEQFEKQLRMEITLATNISVKRKDGSVFYADINSSPITLAGKRYLLGIFRDVTERKQAEEQLVLLATAVEQSAEIIIITNTDGTIQYVNPAFERITGYSREEAIGQNPRILKSGEHDQKFYENLWDTLKKGEVWSGRFKNKKKDGTLYEEDATISPVRDASGNIINYVAVKRDVTLEVFLEAQLHHAQKMETIGTLVGGVAHDFNNLLTVILGNVEFGFQDCSPDDPVYKDLIRIEKAGIHARKLVSQLLSFSRQKDYKPIVLNLNTTIDELLEMLTRIIGGNIKLKTKLAPNLLPICADTVQVQQVLMNLCVNARDAMPQGGELILETRNITKKNLKNHLLTKDESRNFVQLKITDAGVGMDKETQARIFEPFFTTKEVGKGTGLGLSVVYGIVRQHNGHIEVFSDEGKGTTFKIYFPAYDKPKSTNCGAKKLAGVRRRNTSILIVDDEETVRNVTYRILNGLGYKVLTVKDGDEALKIFESHYEKIDLVIMDMVLPKLSGPEIYKRMRAIKPDLSILFVTGYDYKSEMNAFGHLEQRHIRMLQKPYSKESLEKVVSNLLDQ